MNNVMEGIRVAMKQKKPMKGKSSNNKSSISRALVILDWFDTEHVFARASELSTQLDIPRATLHRILNELISWDLIEYSPSLRAYALGPHILELARTFSRSSDLLQTARPYIAKVRNETGETASLQILIGDERICVEEAPSYHSLHWSVPPGRRGPLYAGAAGTVLLAYMQPDKLQAYMKTIELRHMAKNSPASIEELQARLQKIREVGHAISAEENYSGVVGIAAPVLDEAGFAIASVTVSIPFDRWTEESAATYLVTVKKAADTISDRVMLARSMQFRAGEADGGDGMLQGIEERLQNV